MGIYKISDDDLSEISDDDLSKISDDDLFKIKAILIGNNTKVKQLLDQLINKKTEGSNENIDSEMDFFADEVQRILSDFKFSLKGNKLIENKFGEIDSKKFNNNDVYNNFINYLAYLVILKYIKQKKQEEQNIQDQNNEKEKEKEKKIKYINKEILKYFTSNRINSSNTPKYIEKEEFNNLLKNIKDIDSMKHLFEKSIDMNGNLYSKLRHLRLDLIKYIFVQILFEKNDYVIKIRRRSKLKDMPVEDFIEEEAEIMN